MHLLFKNCEVILFSCRTETAWRGAHDPSKEVKHTVKLPVMPEGEYSLLGDVLKAPDCLMHPTWLDDECNNGYLFEMYLYMYLFTTNWTTAYHRLVFFLEVKGIVP